MVLVEQCTFRRGKRKEEECLLTPWAGPDSFFLPKALHDKGGGGGGGSLLGAEKERLVLCRLPLFWEGSPRGRRKE